MYMCIGSIKIDITVQHLMEVLMLVSNTVDREIIIVKNFSSTAFPDEN